MTVQPSAPIVTLVVTTAIFLSISSALPTSALSQDDFSDDDESNAITYEKYYLHDIEEESLGRGVLWALQWTYDRKALSELIPLYGYNIELLLTNEDAESPGATRPNKLCDDPYHERELGFFSVLSSGQLKWRPATYTLGLAGVALQPQSGSGANNDRTSKSTISSASDNQEPPSDTLVAVLFDRNEEEGKDMESSVGVTLAVACEELPHIRETYTQAFSDIQSGAGAWYTQGVAEQDEKTGTWYFVAQNPIPDFEPDRLFWTNPTTDIFRK